MKIRVEVLMVYLPDMAGCDSGQTAWPGVILGRWHGNHPKHMFTEVTKRTLGRVSAVSRGWMEEGGSLFLMHPSLGTQIPLKQGWLWALSSFHYTQTTWMISSP